MSDIRESVLIRREGLRAELAGAGLKWLDAMRDEGAARFAELGVPTIKDENWRYTNLRRIAKDLPLPTITASVDEALAIDLDEIQGLNSYRLCMIDGIFNASASDLTDLPDGVCVTSLKALLNEEPDRVRQIIGSQSRDANDEHRDGLHAMNTAFINDGAVVLIDDGVVLDRPVEIIFIASKGRTETTLVRSVIGVGRGAEANVVERYIGGGSAKPLMHSVTEVAVSENARLGHTRISNESDDTNHVGGTWASVARDGSYQHTMAAIGGALVRHELETRLTGNGAECHLNGLVLGDGKRHVDNHTTIEHVAPHCTSHEHYRSVLDGKSRSIFHGRIRVHEGAQKTDAHQLNKSLLLSEDAQADCKPQLEIYADDVKCSHGATVGQLDEDSKFYLRSRGIDEDSARALLTLAFAEEVLTNHKIEAVRQHLRHAIVKSLVPTEMVDEALVNPASLKDKMGGQS